MSLRAGVAAFALAIGAVCTASPALAQSSITLPSASLEDSLNALSRQSGTQILVDQTLLRGKRAPAIKGASSVEVALAQLLRGSNLKWQRRGDAFLIVRAPSGHAVSKAKRAGVSRASDRQVTPSDAENEQAPSDTGETIVVTGTHIARPELDNPMPVSVTSMEQANNMGLTTAYEALRLDPAIDVGIGEGNAQGQSWDAGVASVDLRGLGVNRTLTLLDGHRRVSGSAQSSAVDLNMIPEAMIDHIEVVTGGAAAIYGADAVTGAVNVITRKDFSGLQLDVTNGVSEYGDGQRFKVSVTAGGKFNGGRGQFILGGTYVNNQEVIYQDRPYTANGQAAYNNPDNTGPDDGKADRLWTNNYQWVAYSPYSNFLIGAAKTPYMIKGGQVVPVTIDPLNASGGGDFPQGFGGNSDGNLYRGSQLQGPTKTLGVMGKLDYQIADGINYAPSFDYTSSKYMGSAGWYRDDQRTNLWLNGNGGAIAYIDNPYMPQSMRDLLIANDLTDVALRKWWTDFPAERQIHDRKNFTINQALNGNLAGGRFKWEAYYQYGRTTDHVSTTNVPLISHWIKARDAIELDDQIVCRDPAARAAGCIPFDIFGETTTSAQQAYATTTRVESRRTSQQFYGADISGRAFALPYGDLSFSLGAEHRTDSLHTVDDPRAATDLPPSVHPNIDASVSVTEVFGELVVPILKNLPLAHKLQIEGAYRYSDYTAYKSTNTWKAGAIWSPIEGLSFRAVRSYSVRAPNFGELYNPTKRGITGSINDPCFGINYNLSATRAKNCAALGVPAGLPQYVDGILTYTGGNPNLKPEASNSLTVGAIVQPRFLPGFDFTVDYWDIDISNVITSYSVGNLENKCVDLPSIDNPFCAGVPRDPVTHKIATIYSNALNAARMVARGVDFGINYRHRIGEGRLDAAFKGTWNIENIVDTTPGIATGILKYDGDYTEPRFRANLYTAYTLGGFSVGLNNQFIGSAVTGQNYASPEYYGKFNIIPARIYTNLSLRYSFDNRYTLGLGVDNLMDVRPPDTAAVWDGGSGRYDTIGRYFFGTIRLKM
jgi:outer membrane receptor protein involved in Fe transport